MLNLGHYYKCIIYQKDTVTYRIKPLIEDLFNFNYLKLYSCTPRLKAELKKLRKMYEEQTEKTKNEYMTVHSRKVSIKILLKIVLNNFMHVQNVVS